MRSRAWPLAVLLPLLSAGCTMPTPATAPERPDRPWNPASEPLGAIVARAPTVPEPASRSASFVLPSNPAIGLPDPPPVAIEPGHAYTLAELIDLAQSSHPETRIAWANARNVALAAGIAESTYLPRVVANVVGGAQNLQNRTSAGGFSVNTDSSASGMIAALSLQWLLFDFGERSGIVEAAQQDSVASNIAFTAAHQRIIYEVCLAYYAHAAARARVKTAEKSLRNAQEIEEAAEARYRRGIGTVIEAAHARQATAQARLMQVQARGTAQNTYVGLVAAMGISPLTRIQVADIPQRKLSTALVAPVDRIVAEALARRPDVQGAYAAQKARNANVRAAEATFRPKVFMSATGAYNSGRLGVTALPGLGQQPPTFNLSGNHWGATVLFGVTMPIYDGHTRDSALQQARADADKATATFERVRDEAVRQIVVAQNDLETSLAAHEAAVVAEKAAQTTFDAALDAYRHGVGSVTDATAAESLLLVTRNASVDAYSSALSAAATLAFATGALGGAPQ
jgi:outer membrane protein TolC